MLIIHSLFSWPQLYLDQHRKPERAFCHNIPLSQSWGIFLTAVTRSTSVLGKCPQSQKKASPSCIERPGRSCATVTLLGHFLPSINIQLTPEQHEFELHMSIYIHFFSINIELALCILEFCIHGFNQQWVETSIFRLRLGIHRCRGLTERLVIRHFIWQTWASADFGIHWGSWNHIPWIPRNNFS